MLVGFTRIDSRPNPTETLTIIPPTTCTQDFRRNLTSPRATVVLETRRQTKAKPFAKLPAQNRLLS